MGNYETLNELLVTLFRDVMDIEQKVIITPEFKDITNNDFLQKGSADYGR